MQMKLRIPLTAKLFVSIGLVLLLSVTLVRFLTVRDITRQFDVYRQRERDVLEKQLADQLAWYHEQFGSWNGVDRLFYKEVEVHVGDEIVEVPTLMIGEKFTLATPQGRIVVSTDLDLLHVAYQRREVENEVLREGYHLLEEELEMGYPILEAGSWVGTLLLGEIGHDLDPHEAAFISSAKRQALVGGGVAAGIAFLLAVLLVSQILSPLRKLKGVTEQLAQGGAPMHVRLKSHDELGQLGESFNRMIDSLQRSEMLRNMMAGDIAHELRTPVTVILGALEAILDGVYAMSNETIAPIYDEALHLSQLIADLRDLALAEAGELELRRKPVDVELLVRQIVEGLALAGEDLPVLRIHAEPDVPHVKLDRKRFRQVLANLLSNAVRHTPIDGEIKVDIRRSAEGIELCVSDTGTGIAEGDLPHVFERFYRGDKARNRTGEGGLGLAIAKHWVEAHGGTIRAGNRPDGGASFIVRLPAG